MISLRKFPHPYQSMLAYCSDIDATSLVQFERIHRWLNTLETDPRMGQGLGLDIADSFWMTNKAKHAKDLGHYMPDGLQRLEPDTMTWWDGYSRTPKNKKDIIRYIKCGWIDSLHSFGNYSRQYEGVDDFKRQVAIDSIEAWEDNDINIDVYIDHGDVQNFQNFSRPEESGHYRGSDPNSPQYHTDLTIPYGFRFTWDENFSDTFGHENLIQPRTLLDGQKMWGYKRYVSDWVANKIHKQITRGNLDNIINNNLYVIVTNHFGYGERFDEVHYRPDPPFHTEARNALKMLKTEQDNGNILVARTSRILKYNLAQLHVRYIYNESKDVITISDINDPQFGPFTPSVDDIRGLTFEGATASTKIFIRNEEVEDISRPTASSVMVNWFEPDYKNYAERLPWHEGTYEFEEPPTFSN